MLTRAAAAAPWSWMGRGDTPLALALMELNPALEPELELDPALEPELELELDSALELELELGPELDPELAALELAL